MRYLQKIRSKYRYSVILLRQMVITDFKLRYQGSLLGYVWSLLRPLFLFVILYIVFVKFLRIGSDIPHYPVYLLSGIVLWNFFAEITNGGVGAIVGRGDLIRKLNFPKYVIILSVAFSAVINLCLNMLVIAFFMAINKVDISALILWAWLPLLEVFVFALAVSFILSALFVRLRDVNYIWEVIMQAMFYATPIIYPLTMVSERWHTGATLLMLNPMAQAIQDFRHLAITPAAQTLWQLTDNPLLLAVPVVFVVVTLVVAVVFFRRRSPHFAEEV